MYLRDKEHRDLNLAPQYIICSYVLLIRNNFKLYNLVLILNQIDKNFRFPLGKSQTRLNLLDIILINKTGTKIWMDV